MKEDIIEVIFSKILGATEDSSIQQLILYIPNKDKNGKPIRNFKKWITKAQKVLTVIGGGSTTMPPADGTWLNPENEETIWEKTTIIYTYIDPDKFEKHIERLREFLHEFGRETAQGEVVFEFDGKFYRIRQFDSK